MEYHRSNKSPLCGLTPTPIATQIRYSYYIFLSQVWEEEVSLIWLDHSCSQPFIIVFSDVHRIAMWRKQLMADNSIINIKKPVGTDRFYYSNCFYCMCMEETVDSCHS